MAHPSPLSRPSSAPPGPAPPALDADSLRDREPDRVYQQLLIDRHAPRWRRDLKRYGWLPQD